MQIRVLDELTINKIAAGEVIEDPSSVVKELVENSLDAGAQEIHVEIAGGGRQLIRVTDDGCGMVADDALLCLERHATSKIRTVEQIASTTTMGFRGEAIPSIASISKFSILTATKEQKEGTLVIVEGGRIQKCCSAACNPGTTIEVKALFFNVPVRRKFQKSPAHDAQGIVKLLTQLALAYPEVRFELVSDQEVCLKAPLSRGKSALDRLGDRILALLGKDYFASLVPLEAQGEPGQLRGYIGLPTHTRPNRSGQYLLINQRSVLSPPIANAVREGYGTALPTQRFPQFVLHLQLPGDQVDVNVHPQKREVRLRQELALQQWIAESVGRALRVTGFTAPPEPSHHYAPEKLPSFSLPPPASPAPLPTYRPAPALPPAPASLPLELPMPTPRRQVPRVVWTLQGYSLLDPLSCSELQIAHSPGIYLLDQRAAHQRVLFERMTRQAGDSQRECQRLLIPLTIECNALEAQLIQEEKERLSQMGLVIEEFGHNSFIIQAVARDFAYETERLFRDILQQLQAGERGLSPVERAKRLALVASRRAISQRRLLTLSEAQGLVTQLFACEMPLECPQGRPIIALINLSAIEKLYG